ncbi:hypothetical protein ACFFX0_04800 [Citricoccus parietis]|uniref:Uncharacterized protein n=1 Tax=Citricoccus parietis TaxID=592307 RepID=A0ABV5FV76_9MICC
MTSRSRQVYSTCRFMGQYSLLVVIAAAAIRWMAPSTTRAR